MSELKALGKKSPCHKCDEDCEESDHYAICDEALDNIREKKYHYRQALLEAADELEKDLDGWKNTKFSKTETYGRMRKYVNQLRISAGVEEE